MSIPVPKGKPTVPAAAPKIAPTTTPAPGPSQVQKPPITPKGPIGPKGQEGTPQGAPAAADMGDELEAFAKELDKPAKPDTEPEKPETDLSAFDLPGDEKEEETKPDEQPKTLPPEKEKPKTDAKPVEPKSAAELRTALAEAKQQAAKLSAELETVKKSQQQQPKEDVERKALTDRLAEEEKKRQALEEKIAYLDYSQSEDFQQRYHQPYEDAYNTAWARLKDLPKADGSGQPSQAELEQLLFSTEEQAYELIENLFDGPRAKTALRLVQKVYGLNEAKAKAMAEAQKTASERSKERVAQVARYREELRTKFEEANKAVAEKYPQYFAPDEDDPEGNELLEKGYKMTDLAYKTPGNLSPDALVKLNAEIRNRAAGFGRMVHRVKRLEAENEKLREELASYQKSVPGEGEADLAGPADESEDWEKGIEQLAEQR